jgi:hypothetical protein
MLQSQVAILNQSQAVAGYQRPADSRRLSREAIQRYRTVQVRAWLGRFRSLLTGGNRHPLELTAPGATRSSGGAHYAGTRAVPIRQIQGSEGRSKDFDAAFRPLRAHNRSRWLSVATAMQRNVILPPVALIQVGDVYYVRDGHHRISVAKALGQEAIDAEVTAWE